MAELLKDVVYGTPWYMYILIAFSIGLLLGSFLCPPIGIIDASAYKSVAIVFAGVSALRFIDNIPHYLDRGSKIRAQVGQASIELEKEK